MPITHYDTTGLSLYVLFDDTDNTAVDLVEGSSLKVGRYVASDASIVTASLDAGTYNYKICVGTAAGKANTDPVVATSLEERVWTGSAFTLDSTQLATILADTNELQTDWANGGRLDTALDYATTGVDTIQSQIVAYFGNVPTTAEFEARTLPSASYATASALSTVAGYVDTEVAAIKVVTDALSPRLPGSGTIATGTNVTAIETSILAAVGAIDVTADVTVNNPVVNVEVCD